MCVLAYTQDRVYGIGWGHRDLEYRRTTVTVNAIDNDVVSFRILGLKSYKDGYAVEMSRSDAEMNAICLDDWCDKHPQDAQP